MSHVVYLAKHGELRQLYSLSDHFNFTCLLFFLDLLIVLHFSLDVLVIFAARLRLWLLSRFPYCNMTWLLSLSDAEVVHIVLHLLQLFILVRKHSHSLAFDPFLFQPQIFFLLSHLPRQLFQHRYLFPRFFICLGSMASTVLATVLKAWSPITNQTSLRSVFGNDLVSAKSLTISVISPFKHFFHLIVIVRLVIESGGNLYLIVGSVLANNSAL